MARPASVSAAKTQTDTTGREDDGASCAIVRSGATGLRSEAKQTRSQGVSVGVDPRCSSGGDARHARLDERGAWPTRSVLSRFMAKNCSKGHGLPEASRILPAQAKGSMPVGLRGCSGLPDRLANKLATRIYLGIYPPSIQVDMKQGFSSAYRPSRKMLS